jgi:phenylacetate-CoA ligase
LHAILENESTVLCCTPTYAIHLAEVAAKNKINLRRAKIKALLVAGEPGGSIPATRARLEKLWPTAHIFDHHGMTEVGPVTFECPAQSGRLHVIETSYIAEIVNPETGQPAEYEAIGELVLTTLGRVGSPLIRYRTGDLVKPSPSGLCECGRYDLGLDGGILGRTDDMIIVRGVNIYPSALEQIISGCGAVTEFRVRLVTSRSLPEIEVDVELVPQADPDAVVQQLQTAFESAFRMRIPVLVLPAGTLPRPEGKGRRFVRV